MSSVHRSNTIFSNAQITQGGPLPVIHGVITPISRVFSSHKQGLKLNGNQLQVGLEGRMHHAALRGWQVPFDN